jgi:Cdc6-like AAA superfamily ATPase
MNDLSKCADTIVQRFASICKSSLPEYKIVKKGGELFLEIYVGNINDNIAEKLAQAKKEIDLDDSITNNIYLSEKKVSNWLSSIEIDILQNLISESLTIGRDSLKSDFYKHFIPFVGGEEKRISSMTNSIVYGRRGAGKSSLILYGCNKVIEQKMPFAWIAMQQFQNRSDLQVIPQVLFEFISQIEQDLDSKVCESLKNVIYSLEKKGAKLTFDQIKQGIPLFVRNLLPFVKNRKALFLFLDDLHLIGYKLQPLLLSSLYSICRGNSIYLKISSIENLTNLFDYVQNEGMQIPGDLQRVALDYNLMTPDKAHKHINDIIESYVTFAGIPNLNILCEIRTRYRLTWVSAGVPRDALYVFNNSITKARNENRTKIAVMDINMAAADAMSEKEKYVTDDIEDKPEKISELLDAIKAFCFDVAKSNAFLVHKEPKNDSYKLIKKLIDLRFLHILHPGITPDRKNEKYEALLLDYAFYTGFRRTPSIKEFKETPQAPTSKELRSLKRFNIHEYGEVD